MRLRLDLRLELRLVLVELFELDLETRHPPLRGKVADEHDVEQEDREQHARRDEHPGELGIRSVGHGLGF
ncbi:MAG: hypothetical protein AUG87_13980 [Candidatus Rokubacteria bacterium 13_1_20CM_4_70_14]|nr:MAG: hypothetical protein AUG87_13980 [Candidatus Rokubacteria bacterium 13_1_20CM_4_70_14]